MSMMPDDYKKIVLEDIQRYNGVRKFVKAGLIERCMQSYCSPTMLHPNPDDEFSMESIGPNFKIVEKYCNQILDLKQSKVFDEPVIVEKMEPDGYMLLNGHHRWYAAYRMNIKKLHIKIVNLIHEEDFSRMLNKNKDHTKRVSFDLDEVLLTIDETDQAPITDSLFARRIKERLRTGAPEVIKALQQQGYDVWIYTANYFSEDYINDFFSMYEITIDGMLNGVNEKRKFATDEAAKIRTLLAEKYERTLHIDNHSVVSIDSKNKTFDQFDIYEEKSQWSDGILHILSQTA